MLVRWERTQHLRNQEQVIFMMMCLSTGSGFILNVAEKTKKMVRITSIVLSCMKML